MTRVDDVHMITVQYECINNKPPELAPGPLDQRQILIFSPYPYYNLLTIYLTNNDCVIGSIEQYSLVAKEKAVRVALALLIYSVIVENTL